MGSALVRVLPCTQLLEASGLVTFACVGEM